ncbi:hypothetical protein HPB51_002268 [Rhipicephalus microplus]|uniref:Secreted protein n=1 Tax=Rhipicephalus microplus TaxID=6941 RepID=A0A9J6DYY2_RHIMP|nr:hypothetical protein HPB51_002268 [Rhipicephalus microplus]
MRQNNFQLILFLFFPCQIDSLRAGETNKHAAMAQLRSYASTEGPGTKDNLSHALHFCWRYHDELHVEDGVLLRSNEIAIHPAKRQEVLHLLHAAH